MSNAATAEATKPKPAKISPVSAAPKAADPKAPVAEPMKFKIEKGVPIPARIRFGAESKYPWKELAEAGDSFFVPGVTVKSFGGSTTSAGKRLKIRLTCRNAEVNGVSGVRVWRAE